MKKRLHLKPTDKENIYVGEKSDGKKYSVRGERKRYFFPDEWEKFYKVLKNDRIRLFFLACLHTGGRSMEVLNLRPCDFDYNRNSIKFEVVKQRKAKKNFYATGKSRSFFVSPNLLKKVKSYVSKNQIDQKAYIFLNNEKLPSDYSVLPNEKRRKYFMSPFVSFSNIFKRALKKAGIEDYYNFSLHNLRKTYGNWMRTFDIRTEEVCYRLGHDMDTYMAHYGSPLIFTSQERRKILRIMGDVQ